MNWHMAAKELPDPNKDVLVCFDNGSCLVACIEVDTETDEHIWWTVDHNYLISPTDMWCEIILPTAEEYHK